jgi:hypothetical protein
MSKQDKAGKGVIKKSELNMEAIDSSLWLVKIPHFVADRLGSLEEDQTVGALSINAVPPSAPGQKASKRISVSLLANEDGDPTEFTLEELSTATDTQMMAFAYDQPSNEFTVQGQVTKKLVLKPEDSVAYRQLLKRRSTQDRKMTQAANPEDILTTRASSNVIDFIPPVRAEMKRKAIEQEYAAKKSKVAMGGVDYEMLRSKLFEAFAINKRQSLKDLLAMCKDVPGLTREKEVKDLLESYAKYHSKGPYRSFWELKPEFQDHSAQNEGSPEGEG